VSDRSDSLIRLTDDCLIRLPATICTVDSSHFAVRSPSHQSLVCPSDQFAISPQSAV
jgi:hypothetical protein